MTNPYTAEASPYSGHPIEALLFEIDESGLAYRYTSFRRQVSNNGIFEPLEGLTISAPSQGQQDSPGTIQITIPSDTLLAQEFQSAIPPTRAMVTVYLWHSPPIDDPTSLNTWATIYDIVDASHTPDVTTLTCASLLSQLDRVVPAGLINRDYCDFRTYDPVTCKVDPDDFRYTGTVTGIDGLIVTVGGAGAFNVDTSFFKFGDFNYGFKHTMIREQAGDDMLLDEMIPGLQIGYTVKLLAGDDRTKEMCLTKFDNIARWRAFSKMPLTNPYYGRGLSR